MEAFSRSCPEPRLRPWFAYQDIFLCTADYTYENKSCNDNNLAPSRWLCYETMMPGISRDIAIYNESSFVFRFYNQRLPSLRVRWLHSTFHLDTRVARLQTAHHTLSILVPWYSACPTSLLEDLRLLVRTEKARREALRPSFPSVLTRCICASFNAVLWRNAQSISDGYLRVTRLLLSDKPITVQYHR